MAPYVSSRRWGNFAAELVVKGIYQWLFFVFPALSLAFIGLIPTLRAGKYRVLYALSLLRVPAFLPRPGCRHTTSPWPQAFCIS